MQSPFTVRMIFRAKLFPITFGNQLFKHLKGVSLSMEMIKSDALKDQLMRTNPEFRELAREHGRYEARLSELSALAHPNDDEQLEETTLKKKKLALKDQMQSIITHHQAASQTEH